MDRLRVRIQPSEENSFLPSRQILERPALEHPALEHPPPEHPLPEQYQYLSGAPKRTAEALKEGETVCEIENSPAQPFHVWLW
jgi:hypothetical protein